MTMFTFNRIIGFILVLCLIYGVLQSWGLLPEGAPVLLPRPSGPPAA
jgi:hypothetical protein